MPDFINPSGFILLRVVGASILFFIIYFFYVKEVVEKKDLFYILACAFFGVAVNQLFFFHGLNLTTPINAAIIMTSNPILVILFSCLIFYEKITIRKSMGICLGLLGACTLILNKSGISLNSNFNIGNLFVLINATSYGVYLVMIKPIMRKYNPITVMFYLFVFGSVYVLPFGYQEVIEINWEIIPKTIYFEILFVIICTTFMAYLLNAFALKRLKPSIVSIYIYLQPVFATLFAIFRESDQLDHIKILSAMIIFLGVYLVSTTPNRS